jgi:hypothetical protein
MTMTTLPEDVKAFRDDYRRRHIGPRYRGWLHFSVTTAGALAAIFTAAWQVRAPRAVDWWIVPITFLIANFGEYFGHRGPMHHQRRGMSVLFRRHTQQHHRFFTDQAMASESPRDFHMVLFPPVMLLFFLGVLATPMAMALRVLVSPNAGWLFAATAVSYFLLYEWCHFAHHLPESSRIGRTRLVRAMRRHHAAHHDRSRMTECNFNVTFPIADWLMGSLARQDGSLRR